MVLYTVLNMGLKTFAKTRKLSSVTFPFNQFCKSLGNTTLTINLCKQITCSFCLCACAASGKMLDSVTMSRDLCVILQTGDTADQINSSLLSSKPS